MTLPRWEHVVVNVWDDATGITDVLAKYESRGWELAAALPPLRVPERGTTQLRFIFKRPMMQGAKRRSVCPYCYDTGTWETGNNDVTCPHCPAGAGR